MDTPICDFVKEYAKSGFSRFHMPGHKGKEFVGCEKYDITEIEGADVLSHADGIIKKSQENATKLFGSGALFYSTEGSSQCIKTMIAVVLADYRWNLRQKSSAVPQKFCVHDREKSNEDDRVYILAARNVHKSMIDALALLDIDVEFIYPKAADSICVSMITPNEVREYLRKISDRQKEECAKHSENVDTDLNYHKNVNLPMAVYITSPDYLGNMADIEGISEVCEEYDIPLIVDNAHGAYMAFLDDNAGGNIHPIKRGAAICCDSAHKTLPVLTGGAYIHVSEQYKERFVPYIPSLMTMFGSTSPSYLIMQSLDMCNRYLAEKFKYELDVCIKRIEQTKKVLIENNVKLMKTEPLKIVIDSAAAGMNGEELAEELRSYQIECEYADKYFVVLMITPQNDEKDFLRLEKWSVDTKKLRFEKKAIKTKTLLLNEADRVMSIRKAAFSPYRKIKVSDAEGKVCASQTIACPPAIPIAVCGEKIDKNMIEIFKEYGIKYVHVIED